MAVHAQPMEVFRRWREDLNLALDHAAIARLMHDHVLKLLPSDLAALPLDCQHALENAGADIQGTAFTLLQAELRFHGPAETSAYLHELAHTFASASIRLTQVYGRPAR